jgi:hypothetical protein
MTNGLEGPNLRRLAVEKDGVERPNLNRWKIAMLDGPLQAVSASKSTVNPISIPSVTPATVTVGYNCMQFSIIINQ